MALDIGWFFQNLYDKYIASKPAENVQPENFTPVDANLNPVNFTPYDLSQQSQFTPVDENLQPLNFTPVDMSLNPLNFTPVEPTTLEPLNFTPVDNNLNPINFTPVNPETLQPNNFTPYDLGKLSWITQVDENLNPVNFTPYDLNLNTEEIQNFTPFNTAPITPPSQDNWFIDTLRNIAPAIWAEMLIPWWAVLAWWLALWDYLFWEDTGSWEQVSQEVKDLIKPEEKSIWTLASDFKSFVSDISWFSTPRESIAKELGVSKNLWQSLSETRPEVYDFLIPWWTLWRSLLSAAYSKLSANNENETIENNSSVENSIKENSWYDWYIKEMWYKNQNQLSKNKDIIPVLSKEQYNRIVNDNKLYYIESIKERQIIEKENMTIWKESEKILSNQWIVINTANTKTKALNEMQDFFDWLTQNSPLSVSAINQERWFFLNNFNSDVENIDSIVRNSERVYLKAVNEWNPNAKLIWENLAEMKNIANLYPERVANLYKDKFNWNLTEEKLRERIKNELWINVWELNNWLDISLSDLANVYITWQEPWLIIQSPLELLQTKNVFWLAARNIRSKEAFIWDSLWFSDILWIPVTAIETVSPITNIAKLWWDSLVDNILRPWWYIVWQTFWWKDLVQDLRLWWWTAVDSLSKWLRYSQIKDSWWRLRTYRDYAIWLSTIAWNLITSVAEIILTSWVTTPWKVVVSGKKGFDIVKTLTKTWVPLESATKIANWTFISRIPSIIDQTSLVWTKALNYWSQVLKTELAIEALISPYDTQLWSQLSRDIAKVWLVWWIFLETVWPAFKTARSLQRWTTWKSLEIVKKVATETWDFQISTEALNQFEETIAKIYESSKSLWEEWKTKADTALKNVFVDWVRNKQIIDEAISNWVISKTLLRRAAKWEESAIDEFSNFIKNVPQESLQLYEELKRVANDWQTPFKDMFSTLTSIESKIPTNRLLESENITAIDNWYSIKKWILAAFEEIWWFSALRSYSKKELDTVFSNPRFSSNIWEIEWWKYKYWIKQEDWKYKLDWANSKEEIWVYKQNISTKEIKDSLDNWSELNTMMSNINQRTWAFENIDELISNWDLEKLDTFLSKIFC